MDGGVQVDTTVPSPVSTPHALPELLDPPIGSEPDAASSVFVPGRMITPQKTHLLVPPQPTPPSPERPTPPISNDEAPASDGGSTIDSTTPLSGTYPQLQLTHSPAQTLPSPTPPMYPSNAPASNIVTSLEHARHQVEAVHLPAQPVLSPPRTLTRPAESETAPKSDIAASHKFTPTSKRAPQQVDAVQPVQAHPGPQVFASPMTEPAPASSVAVPSAPEYARPRIEPVHSPNLPARTPEALTPPLHSNLATASNAPAPVRVAAVSESAYPQVEMVHRPVQLVPAPRSLKSPTGSKPAPTVSASAPSKIIPTPDRTRPLAAEAVRLPAQHTRPIPKSLAPVGNVSVATLTPSDTRSQAAAVSRPVYLTPESSALPVCRGPVPASSVPTPNMVRLPLERARPQVGAGRTPTLVPFSPPESRVPLIGKTPAGSASGPDTKEVSRPRIKTHPRKMVTPVGQRRSVVAPAPSSYGSRTETSGVVSGAETPQGNPTPHSTTPTVLPRWQVGSVSVVPEPVLRSSAHRNTLGIHTMDLLSRHKPQIANGVRPPSIAESVETPTLSKSPMLDTSQPTPTRPDSNRVESGIELWDHSEPLGVTVIA